MAGAISPWVDLAAGVWWGGGPATGNSSPGTRSLGGRRRQLTSNSLTGFHAPEHRGDKVIEDLGPRGPRAAVAGYQHRVQAEHEELGRAQRVGLGVCLATVPREP